MGYEQRSKRRKKKRNCVENSFRPLKDEDQDACCRSGWFFKRTPSIGTKQTVIHGLIQHAGSVSIV